MCRFEVFVFLFQHGVARIFFTSLFISPTPMHGALPLLSAPDEHNKTKKQ